jgi:exopolysaccharide biosynthesis WecB/TagA/CpsF family protein
MSGRVSRDIKQEQAMTLTAKSNWCFRWMRTLDHILCVHSKDELELFMKRLSDPQGPETLAFVNAHAMNCVAAMEDFGSALWEANIVVRDGSGMSILLKVLQRSPGLNLNGTDLIPRIIARYDGKHIALLGTRAPYLQQAVAKVKQTLAPHSAISELDGFQSQDSYLEHVRQHRPALIVLGMGMPKQEQIAAMLHDKLDYPCLIVCGGAIIDFLGDRVARAPVWVRSFGAEWIFRLLQEPKRLFERYVLGNPLFLWRSVFFKWGQGKWSAST